MPSAKIHPEPIWKQLGIPSIHEQYLEKYGNGVSLHAPYSGPRGHPQTLREEANEYKQAIREWRAHEYEMGEHMARCMKPRAPPPPKSNIQQPVVQAVLKPTKPKKGRLWDRIIHKILCIPYMIVE
jgi:hypothetical protein